MDIRKLTRAEPFKPFRVFLTNGESFDINYPDMILATANSVVISAPPEDNPGLGSVSFQMRSWEHLLKTEFL